MDFLLDFGRGENLLSGNIVTLYFAIYCMVESSVLAFFYRSFRLTETDNGCVELSIVVARVKAVSEFKIYEFVMSNVESWILYRDEEWSRKY